MPTDAKLQVIHVFPTQDSFVQNQTSVEENDLAFAPCAKVATSGDYNDLTNKPSLTPDRLMLSSTFTGTSVGAMAYVCGVDGRSVSNRGDLVSGTTLRLVEYVGFQVYSSDDRVSMGRGSTLTGSWRLLAGVNGSDYLRWTLAVRIS